MLVFCSFDENTSISSKTFSKLLLSSIFLILSFFLLRVNSKFFLEILTIVLFLTKLSSKYLSILGKEKNEKIKKYLLMRIYKNFYTQYFFF